jgi:hypothetical protein
MAKSKSTMASPTFHQQLVNAENKRHANRLAEIKKAETMLRLFEPTAVALAAKNIRLDLEWFLSTYDKCLRVTSGGLTEWDHRLYDALITEGFSEISRSSGAYPNVKLKKGRLSLSVTVMENFPTISHQVQSVQTSAQATVQAEVTCH